MAAAIAVPLIAGLGRPLIDLIAGLVHPRAIKAEAVHGAGTGPVKLADVFNDVKARLQSAVATGTIGSTLPSDDQLMLIIQAVVSSMKLQGMLESSPTTMNAKSVTLPAGQTLTIAAV